MSNAAGSRFKKVSLKLGFERDWYLVLLAAIIGLVMGGVATAFILPLRWIEEYASDSSHPLTVWIIALAPIGGALLASLALRIGPHTEGGSPGVPAVMYSIHRRKARLPILAAVHKWIASTLTIGSGGSAGPEGPIVTIGSVIGSNLARLLKVDPQVTGTLLGCGAAAGIASVFNAPIAGIFFVLEVLLRDFSLRTFTPIVIASVVSAAWTRTLLGTMEPLFLVDPNFFQDGYQFTIIDIPYFLVLGVMCGIAAVGFIRLLVLTENCFARIKVSALFKPAIGAALLGLIGVAYLLLVKPSHNYPPFFGSGYTEIRRLLTPASYSLAESGLTTSGLLIGALAAGLVVKAIATCLTLGSGGSGGLFAPSLLLGAAAGGLFGAILNATGLAPDANPAHYALVGMAAMIAATAHAPLTGILIVYEITLQYELILPLMLTAVISTIVGRLLYRESIYTFKLSQLGVRLGAMGDLTILRRLSVHDVKLTPAVTVHFGESAQRLLELSERHLVRDFVVVDDQQRYVGMVTGDDLSAALIYREAIPLLQIAELQRTDLPTVTEDETLDIVLDKFSTHDAHSLAVIDERNGRVVRGLVTRSMLMARYQAALSTD